MKTKISCLMLTMLIIMSIISVPVIAETTDDFDYRTFTDDSKYEHSMPYRIFVPKDYDKTKEYPLFLYFHGAGRRGTDNENHMNNPKVLLDKMLTKENQDKYPCIIIVPQCPENEQWVDTPWVDGSYNQDDIPISDELLMVVDIIDSVKKEYNIDQNRVYVAGQSMGGYGTWDIISRYPDMFAAAIPMCGAGDPSKAEKLSKVAIWAFHGDADNIVPVTGSRDMVNSIKKVSNLVKYTEYPDVDHEVQQKAFLEADLIPWLFSQSREEKQIPQPTAQPTPQPTVKPDNNEPKQPNEAELLKKVGVLRGGENGDLMLDEVLTRQDMVVLMVRLMGEEQNAMKYIPTYSFSDVTEFYKPIIGWAQDKGLIKGIGDGKFGFDEKITAQQFSALLFRVLGYIDENEINYDEVFSQAKKKGMFEGITINDDDLITRGNMAKAVYNVLNIKTFNGIKLSEKLKIEI